MRYIFIFISFFLSTLACGQNTSQSTPPPQLGAQDPLGLNVKSYILVEAKTGQVLTTFNPNEERPPASMTKLMTAYVVFNALKSGVIHLDDLVSISERAYRQEGSRMFAEINAQISVEDLLKGMIVQSGNDASIALAEKVGSSVEHFVSMMNQAAQSLGMNHTHFMNPTGLPDPNHYSSAADMAKLARAIVNRFPEYYSYYKIKEFSWNNIKQNNRNRLLWVRDTIDGLKTGHTQEAGYCLVASEMQGNMRLISVVFGAANDAQRSQSSQALLDYGFRTHIPVQPLTIGKIITQGTVLKGVKDTINLTVDESPVVILPKNASQSVKANIKLDAMVAPIEKGKTVGKMTVSAQNTPLFTVPVITAEAVDEGSLYKRTMDAIKLWWKK